MSERTCAYCGAEVLTGSERPEHPIPAALGSSFVVTTVCDPCNDWANVHVDQPFLRDDWVRLHRADHDIRDPRRAVSRPVPHPLRHGKTPDGRHVVLRPDGQWVVRPRVEHRGDQTTVQASSMEEAERIVDQVRERALRDGFAIDVGDVTTESGPLDVKIEFCSDLKAWMRMGAKIALAAGSVAYDLEWRSGPDADYLRRLLRDGEDDGKVLIPEFVGDDHVFRQICDSPEHVVWFVNQAPTKLLVVLFGELFFAMPVHAEPRRAPDIAWRLDPRRPRASGQLTHDELLYRAIERNPPPPWED